MDNETIYTAVAAVVLVVMLLVTIFMVYQMDRSRL